MKLDINAVDRTEQHLDNLAKFNVRKCLRKLRLDKNFFNEVR